VVQPGLNERPGERADARDPGRLGRGPHRSRLLYLSMSTTTQIRRLAGGTTLTISSVPEPRAGERRRSPAGGQGQ
jgi:hypothetical protein